MYGECEKNIDKKRENGLKKVIFHFCFLFFKITIERLKKGEGEY
jgi:hypothetical protein